MLLVWTKKLLTINSNQIFEAETVFLFKRKSCEFLMETGVIRVKEKNINQKVNMRLRSVPTNQFTNTFSFSLCDILFRLNMHEERQRWEEMKWDVLDQREEEEKEEERLYLHPGPERRTAAVPGGQPPPETACSSSSAPLAQQHMNEAAREEQRRRLDLLTSAPQQPQGFTRPLSKSQTYITCLMVIYHHLNLHLVSISCLKTTRKRRNI